MKAERGKLHTVGFRKIFKGLSILLAILSVGTVGYILIEGWGLLDSLYMTVITIATVGYREVGNLSEPGKVFTILIILFGVGIIAYLLGMVAQAMIDLQIRSIFGRHKLEQKIRSIKDHYIICGYGRIGRIICRELKANDISMVVIDSNGAAMQRLEEWGIPHIVGDATSEEILSEAHIERAKGLVSVVASDADNVFITMSARGLNPELFILARAEEEHTEKKLIRAGANKVVMPYLIGGQKMAYIVAKPVVSDFLEFTVHNRKIGLEIAEVAVSEKSSLNGMTLIESGIRQKMDIIIVAVKKKDGEMRFNPSSQSKIEAGDILIALGNNEDIIKLAEILCG